MVQRDVAGVFTFNDSEYAAEQFPPARKICLRFQGRGDLIEILARPFTGALRFRARTIGA